MIRKKDAQMIVSMDFEYATVSVDDLRCDNTWKNCHILSIANGFTPTVVPIVYVSEHTFSGEMTELVIESSSGKRRNITLTNNELILTKKRGYLPVTRVNKAEILVDDEGRLNKVVSINQIVVTNEPVFSLSTKFTNNFFVNGFTVKSGR